MAATLQSQFLGQAIAFQSSAKAAKQAQRTVTCAAPKKEAAKVASKAKATAKNTVAKVASAARKAAAPVSSAELGKWYGPSRRIYLPEGLLDPSEIPDYLTGEVPGDYGYDPLGLGKKPQDFARYQAAELIHSRWAMLGAAGFILPEAFNKFGAVCGPEAVWFRTGAQLLEGDSLQYFGATIPLNLAAAVVAEVILVGGAEYYRSTNKSPLGSDLDTLHPGGPFDPLNLAKDPETFALLKVKEIKNGRLAMFSMLGFFVQAYVTGEGPVENLTAHLSDPFGTNLLSVLAGNAERLPTL
eukprot:jgi/Mesen1/4041/ME000213S03070